MFKPNLHSCICLSNILRIISFYFEILFVIILILINYNYLNLTIQFHSPLQTVSMY